MTVARPLVVRFGALGDMVMITPLLRALSERFGQPCDVLGSGAWTADIFKGLPWVADVYRIAGRKTPYWLSKEQRQLVAQLKQRGPSPVWFLEDMPKAWRLMRRAGITAAQSVRMTDAPRGVDEHTVKHWLRLAQRSPEVYPSAAASAEALHFNTVLNCSEDERADCEQWLQKIDAAQVPLILIQAGSKKTMKGGRVDRASNLKYWPEQDWAALIKNMLAAMPQAKVLLCGAPSEQDLARHIQTLVNDERVLAVADQLPLRRLVGLMDRAHSCVSVDTGPAHMAAALNCPLTVLFGETNARLYHPVSSQSQVEIVSQTALADVAPGSAAWAAVNTMSGITVDKVMQAWLRLDAKDV